MSSLFLPNNDPGANVIVTKEEFNLFHNIDRILFTRLVLGLGRDTSQSLHVVAFIMWLEKVAKDSRIVAKLLHWPDSLLNDVADESLLALNCIESPQFPYFGTTDHNKVFLPLIQKITRSTVSLQYFHEKRMSIIPGVTKLLNDVCLRAFPDIVHQVHYQKAMKEQNFNNAAAAQFYGPVQPNNPYVQQQVMYYAAPAPAPAPVPVPVPAGVTILPQHVVVPQQQWNEGNSSGWVGAGAGAGFDPYNVQNNKEFNQEFHEILANLKISDDAERNDFPPPDDRTIFMTFSKGYPISEIEVREFFSRRYGDIIESVFMQEVQPTEQPLYARLVVRPEAVHMVDGLLDGTSRVKFSINGKHVWVRRYFRKGNKSPPRSSPAPSSPLGAGTSY